MKLLLHVILFGFAVMLNAAEMPPCPLTDAQARNVLKSLNRSRSDMKPVADAMNRGDVKRAKAEYAKFVRAQAAAECAPIKRSQSYNTSRADRIAAGYAQIVGIEYQFPDGVYDWSFNPTHAPSFDPEWTWQLNRMEFWPELARAYHATQNEKYAKAWCSQLRSWATAMKRPQNSGNQVGSGWRTIECGIRLGGDWPNSFRFFANSASVTDDDVLLYIYCSLEQMRHLVKHSTSGNWLAMEMNGVYTFAARHPEFKESAPARKFAVNRLGKDLQEQILPDGAQYELSTGYQVVALRNAAELYRKVKASGRENELPDGFREILAKGVAYLPKLMTPNRNVPFVNDAWSLDLPRTYRREFREFADDPAAAWVADGAVPQKNAPAFTSCFLPWAGYVIFRENWNVDANYMLFDVGPLGKSHIHQDKLNLNLYGYGEELLFDDGGGMYEQSKIREYATSAWDHSVIQIDGKAQNRQWTRENRISNQPVDAKFETRPDFDFAEGVYDDFFGKEKIATHRRQVIFVKPDLFLVYDRLTPHDEKEHHYEARWQVDSVKMREILPGSGICQSERGKKAELIVAPLLADGVKARWSSVETTPPMRGMYVGRNPRPYRPAVTVSHEKDGAGVQEFLTLLYPVKNGSADGIKSVKQDGRNVAVCLQDNRTLQVKLPDDDAQRPEWSIR